MAFASKIPGMLHFASTTALFASALGAGCITTNPIDFQTDQNFPPSVVSQPLAEFPLNEIGQINLDDVVDAEMPLEVVIRDPNVDQALQYRIFVDSPPPPEAEFPNFSGTIDPSGLVERDQTFPIPLELLPAGACHKIELVVVGEFASFVEPRRPVEPGDFDQATWWVEVTDADNPIPTRCR